MDKEVEFVINGFMGLSNFQQKKVIRRINEYQEKRSEDQRRLRENVRRSVTKMQTGPHGPSCPCCGRKAL